MAKRCLVFQASQLCPSKLGANTTPSPETPRNTGPAPGVINTSNLSNEKHRHTASLKDPHKPTKIEEKDPPHLFLDHWGTKKPKILLFGDKNKVLIYAIPCMCLEYRLTKKKKKENYKDYITIWFCSACVRIDDQSRQISGLLGAGKRWRNWGYGLKGIKGSMTFKKKHSKTDWWQKYDSMDFLKTIKLFTFYFGYLKISTL